MVDLPVLSHAEQQQAVEKIQQLMAEGLSSGEAIAQVANAIRSQHKTMTTFIFDDDETD